MQQRVPPLLMSAAGGAIFRVQRSARVNSVVADQTPGVLPAGAFEQAQLLPSEDPCQGSEICRVDVEWMLSGAGAPSLAAHITR